MTPDERLITAVEQARATYRCAECFSSDVGADKLPDGSWRPWIAHYLSPVTGEWCDCLASKEAAARCSLDLLDVLADAAAPIAQYNPDMPWHRRMKVNV